MLLSYTDEDSSSQTLVVICYVMLGIYACLLAWCCLNIKLYLFDQQRYKAKPILSFYLLALLILLCEILMQTDTIIFTQKSFLNSEVFTTPAMYDACYVLVLFARAIMGYYQVGSLVHLGITVSYQNS